MMTNEQEEGLKELGLVVAENKDDEIWYRVADNLKKLVAEIEKQIAELPSQLKANKELLEFALTKTPKK